MLIAVGETHGETVKGGESLLTHETRLMFVKYRNSERF